jgi:hypothetical protein
LFDGSSKPAKSIGILAPGCSTACLEIVAAPATPLNAVVSSAAPSATAAAGRRREAERDMGMEGLLVAR